MSAPADPLRAALVVACQRALEEAQRGENPPEAVAEELLRDLAAANALARPMARRAREGVFRAIQTLQARFERSTPTLGIATGLTALDTRLGGLHRGEVVLISGANASGRSALALHLAHAVASASGPTVLRCLQDSMPAVTLRMLLGAARAEHARSFTGGAWDRLVEQAARLSDAPLWVVDDGPATIPALGALCDALDTRIRPEFALGLALVVVDDLDVAREGMRLALQMLKRLARRRELAVVATAPRGVELRTFGDEVPNVMLRVRRRGGRALILTGGRRDGAWDVRAELVLGGGGS